MAATQNGLTLPAEVTLQASEAEVKFTPRELRMIREFYGRSFTQIVSDDDTDEKFSVFAWLKLRRAGYDVHTSSHLGDALILMRVTRFDLVLVGPELSASPGTQQSFQAACARCPVIELGSEFSTLDAGEAGAGLLAKIAERLSPST